MLNSKSILELEGGTLEDDDMFEEACNSFIALIVSLAALDDDGPKGRTSGWKVCFLSKD